MVLLRSLYAVTALLGVCATAAPTGDVAALNKRCIPDDPTSCSPGDFGKRPYFIMSDSVPVILCGKTEQIGATVVEAVKPELEVIHFVTTTEAGVVQIPALLRGEKNDPSNSALGSKDYDWGVGAIILGAGYDDQAIQILRDASQGLKPVPWLRPDTSKPAPPLGPEYGKALVARIKETVKELQAKGKMNEDAVIYY
ncbi:uncharacterized protein KD926_004376 [Aspergillus affinis]|uniref:uncharacterized protein n=1 Tax=Aspergillus affinis TaxID=1070780 RepID=UPI0022FDE7F4|nr:uncharacterized protein KD926_004376 [Aspergillus affinis]KAI9043193.1 hypothetical protein KD926_004376 [Aspergillus affinis]